MSDDDEDGLDFPEIVHDPDGRVRFDRVLTALRGAGSPRPNLFPALTLGLAGSVPVGLLVGWLRTATLAGALDTAGTYFAVAAVCGLLVVMIRTENYFEDDETVAAERLKARYAAGEIDHEEFRRRVGPVLREGPTALDDGDSDGSADGDENREGDAEVTGVEPDDPETILRQRFARGEIDREEYERRLTALRESTAEERESERHRDPELN